MVWPSARGMLVGCGVGVNWEARSSRSFSSVILSEEFAPRKRNKLAVERSPSFRCTVGREREFSSNGAHRDENSSHHTALRRDERDPSTVLSFAFANDNFAQDDILGEKSN